MCLVHKRNADGPEQTQDGLVPESWLTEEELAEKVAANLEEKGYHLCNELTDEEWVEVASQLRRDFYARLN
jgi:hypothetical protein